MSSLSAPVDQAQSRDPLSTLSSRDFSRLLEQACVRGWLDEPLSSEALRRAEAGRLEVRDLCALMFRAPRTTQWAVVRRRALSLMVGTPEWAASVLSMEQHVSSLPRHETQMEARGPAEARWFLAQVTQKIGPHEFVSAVQRATTKRRAEHLAIASVLAKMADLPDELEHGAAHSAPTRGPGPEAVRIRGPASAPPTTGPSPSHQAPADLRLLQLGRPAFGDELRRCGAQRPDPVVVEHAVERARCGLLEIRDVFWLLFKASAPEWAAARIAALECAAAHTGMAAQVLQMYGAEAGCARPERIEPAAVGGSPAGFAALAEIQTGRGSVRGKRFVAPAKDAARHGAAVFLLARLAQVQEPETVLIHPGPSQAARFTSSAMAPLHCTATRTAAMTLHTAYQRGMFTMPQYAAIAAPGAQRGCRGGCEVRGSRIEAVGYGSSAAAAKDAAATVMVLHVNRALENGQSAPAAQPPSPTPATPPPAADTSTPGTTQETPQAAAPRASCTGSIPRARTAGDTPSATPPHADRPRGDAGARLAGSLARGYAVAFDPADGPDGARFLLYSPVGSDLPRLPGDEGLCERSLMRQPRGSTGPVLRQVPCVHEAVVPCALALLAAAPQQLHPTGRAWAQGVRLALSLLARKRAYPTLAADGAPTWRLTPVPEQDAALFTDAAEKIAAQWLAAPHGTQRLPADADAHLHAFLDVFADRFTVPPGAPLLLGEAPFIADSRPAGYLRPWSDQVAQLADPTPAPGMVLQVDPPADPRTPTLRARLLLHEEGQDPQDAFDAHSVWSGHAVFDALPVDLARRVGRSLRAAAALHPPLHRLGMAEPPERLLLAARDAVALLGPDADRLREAGVQVTWTGQWTSALDLETVVKRARIEDGDDGIGLDSLLYMEWQAKIDGQPLSAHEMDALAEAHRPLVRVRERWVLVDDSTSARLRARRIAQMPVAEILLDLLHGQITIDGQDFACTPSAGLSEMISLLRVGERTADLAQPPAALAHPLFPHQHRAFDWLARTTGAGLGACLADDMGLGKTVTALALHLHSKAAGRPGPTLVLCPGSLVINWAREIAHHAPGTALLVYHGPDRDLSELSDACIVITSYGTMAQDLAELSEHRWNLVIADEAQMMKNPNTRTARCARAVPAAARVAMTGTPVENQLNDLWSIMNWSNPGLFGTRPQFRRRYARPIEKPRAPIEREQALERLHTVMRPFLLRRLKSDPAIELNLPAKHEYDRLIAVSRTQAGFYEAVRREARTALERRGPGAGTTVLRLLQDLRMICNAPAHYTGQPPEAMREDPQANEQHAPKLEAVREIVETAWGRGNATLVYTTYARMGLLIQAHLTACGYPDTRFMYGDAPAPERQPMVDALQSGRIPVLVLTRRVGGVGLNLTRATEVVHYDPDWNPAAEAQANDRAYRLGQTRDVTVHRLITAGTVEEKIASRADWKRRLADSAVPARELNLDELDADEITDLFDLGDH
jgi:superfamily II DNA or RNA helicase